MKVLNQVINAKSLIVAGVMAALSSVATAESYKVTVEMNSSIGETPLIAKQTQAMSYPVIEVNEATQEGAICRATDSANTTGNDNRTATNANSLCPGATGSRSIVQFTGVPSAIITVERGIAVQEKNGVRFGSTSGTTYNDVRNFTLSNGDGSADIDLSSAIVMFDKALVTDATMEFNYDISAAYQ